MHLCISEKTEKKNIYRCKLLIEHKYFSSICFFKLRNSEGLL